MRSTTFNLKYQISMQYKISSKCLRFGRNNKKLHKYENLYEIFGGKIPKLSGTCNHINNDFPFDFIPY